MSYFILLYKFISCVYINSTYNYHKLYLYGVVGLFFDPFKDLWNVNKDKDKVFVGVGCIFDTDAYFR